MILPQQARGSEDRDLEESAMDRAEWNMRKVTYVEKGHETERQGTWREGDDMLHTAWHRRLTRGGSSEEGEMRGANTMKVCVEEGLRSIKVD